VKLKRDENLSRHLAKALSTYGHDVDSAASEGLLKQPDEVIGEAARTSERLLLTLDLDFADVRKYPPGSHPGIILFRPTSLGFRAVNRFVETFVRDADLNDLRGCLVIVDPKRVRVRRPKREE